MKIKQYDNINCGAACLVSRAKHLWSQKILVVLCLVSVQLFAQQDTVIQGIVVDQETTNPFLCALSIAAGRVYLNQEGRFALTVTTPLIPTGLYFCHRICIKQVTLSMR